MNINHQLTLIAALVIAVASTALTQQKPDELKQRILAQAQSISPDDYAFTRTIKSEGTSNGKTEQHVNVDKFDPTKSGDARWTLVSRDGAAPSADALSQYKKDAPKRRVPGYYRLAGYFAAAATASTDSRGRTVFHFTALPKDIVKVMDSDVSQNATADASVSEADGAPFVERLHVTVRPMRLKLIARLESYEFTARYRIGPEGKPLLMEQSSDMSGSGMGQTGGAHTVVTYSDYRAIK
jgi:membrane-bound lytic murein transglycosylase